MGREPFDGVEFLIDPCQCGAALTGPAGAGGRGWAPPVFEMGQLISAVSSVWKLSGPYPEPTAVMQ